MKPNRPIIWVSYLFAVFFTVGALGNLNHLFLGISFGLLAFISFPFGHKWLERKFEFNFTPLIKTCFYIILTAVTVALSLYYNEEDRKESILQKGIEQKEAIEKIAFEKKEKQRKDSLSFYLESASKNKESNLIAENYLKKAALFTKSENDKVQYANIERGVVITYIHQLIKKGKYENALGKLSPIIALESGNAELFYNRAQCFYGMGDIENAIADLNTSKTIGYNLADNLYEKINPIRRRVSYYVTRCCDGSTSSATGRGACSWHGGVCNWNDPVYEEYRKY